MTTKRKTGKRKKTSQMTGRDFLEYSHEQNMKLAHIISYLRCKDAGIELSGNFFDPKEQKKTAALIKKMSKSERERYKMIAGVGKYRQKPDPNAPKPCPHCGQYPAQPSNFPSRVDTWPPQPSLVEVFRDYEQRNAYANEIR